MKNKTPVQNEPPRTSPAPVLKIGLTGGIGSGKSAVLSLLRQKGALVLQTDEVARHLLERGDIRTKIARRFGKKVLNGEGGIDRPQLAAAAFSSRKNQKALNLILHPEVRKEVSAWIQRQKRGGNREKIAVVEVPLLFERGYYRFFDGILSVSAAGEIRKKRLLKKGWDLGEIKRRDRLQWTQARKNKMADWVIFNNGSKAALRRSVHQWLCKIESGKFSLGSSS